MLKWSFTGIPYSKEHQPVQDAGSCSVLMDVYRTCYASVINKYAPHPNAAALTRETMFSDEGQTYLASWQVRSLQEKISQLQTNTRIRLSPRMILPMQFLISDADAYSAACETAKTRWEEEVAPLLVQ